MKDIYRVAIDGPSGAGKSTIAKAVAAKLGIDYIDTGAMYRAVGYKVREEEINADDEEQLNGLLADTDIDFVDGNILLDGKNVNDVIRTNEISMMASAVSAKGPVREKLVEIQRAMGQRKSIIMDGRDIGTNVLKDAEYKIYLTASAEERADRRYKELVEKGEDVNYDQILEDIKQRDHNDMTRKLNPLRKADDAVELDTTGMGIQQVVDAVLEIIGR
ncbi:MAG: (d)CMP kinase [Firmicutes bacterium]|nr:(d)CMP kinase [Bacillota bacterium]